MSFETPTTRSPFGLTNAAPQQTMGKYGAPDPTWAHEYKNDFDTYLASDWTVTVLNSTTRALTPGAGGRFLVTNTTGIADLTYMQLVAAGFTMPTTANPKDAFFKFRGKISSVANTVFHAGLIMTSTTPVAANDGLFIHKPTGSGAFFLKSRIGGVETSVAFPSTMVAVDATDFEVGFHVAANVDVEAFFNPTTGAPSYAPVSGTTMPGRVAVLTAPGLTTANLAVSFGLLNSTAAAHTLNVDYVVAAQNR